MKIQYLIIAIVLLGCSPEDARVTGFIILNKNETVSALPVNDSDNSSAIVREKPTLLVYPQMLVAKTSVDDNANESTSSKRPIVLPILTVAPTTTKNPCTDIMCPMIACKNSLPAIPSQGICCTRCVTNSACNTTACPKLNCSAQIIPANLTAGECCDRCAPASVKYTASTKKPSAKPTKVTTEPRKITPKPTETTSEPKKTTPKPAKTTFKPKKNRPPPSSSWEDNSRTSSSEHEYHGERPGHNIRSFNPELHRNYSRLIHLLTEVLDEFRDSRSHRSYDDFNDESQEYY